MPQLLWTLILSILTAGAVVTNYYLPETNLEQVVHTLVALTVTNALFRLILGTLIQRRITERKTAFLFRRLLSAGFYVVVSLWILTIWVEDAETLLLSYGLVTAGIALALQDVFKNAIGGLVLLLQGTYHIGDRIEIKGMVGDVVAINLMQTVILEIREWVRGDQPTGRLTFLPNKLVLSETVYNFTKDHGFIWDELNVPITHESDWQKAKKILLDLAQAHTASISEEVEQQMKTMHSKYFLRQKPLHPEVYVELTSNWTALTLRYVCKTLDRRETQSVLYEGILKALNKQSTIEIASETLAVSQGN